MSTIPSGANLSWMDVQRWGSAGTRFVAEEMSAEERAQEDSGVLCPTGLTLEMAMLINGEIFSRYAQVQREMNSLVPIRLGALEGLWQFPTDHLPVDVEVNSHEIVSWNVLNSCFMHWITAENSQGLKGSMISDLHKPMPGKGLLTVRENLIIEMLLDMMGNQRSPKSLIALQEVGPVFLKELMDQIAIRGAPFQCLAFHESSVRDQCVILWNPNQLEYCPDDSIVVSPFAVSNPRKRAQDMTFKSRVDGKTYRVFNVHVPGNPDSCSKKEWAQAYLTKWRPGAINISLGDFNFQPFEMDTALANEMKGMSTNIRVKRVSPYRTNVGIGPDIRSKAIDHVFVSAEDGSAFTTRAVEPQRVLSARHGLTNALDLLSQQRV